MTAREIGFPCSAWEVRAILEGRKVQARRVIKLRHDWHIEEREDGSPWPWHPDYVTGGESDNWARCPYGKPGDRLWVRETWGVGSRPDPWGGYDGIEYRADEEWLDDDEDLTCYKVKIPDDVDLCDYRNGWKSSTSMPRWASRITLEVVEVRAERLQDISEDDACAEGCQAVPGWAPSYSDPANEGGHPKGYSAREAFRELWDSINAKRSPWERNDLVWAVTFRRVEP